MKALSIRQPWAYLICQGYKDIENRTWPTEYRGRIYIHAGKRVDGRNYTATKHIVGTIQRLLSEDSLSLMIYDLVYKRQEPRWSCYYGAIIGEVDIVDCVTGSDSPWFAGPYGFVLANPRLYDTPISYRGRLGFFEVPFERASARATMARMPVIDDPIISEALRNVGL